MSRLTVIQEEIFNDVNECILLSEIIPPQCVLKINYFQICQILSDNKIFTSMPEYRFLHLLDFSNHKDDVLKIQNQIRS